MSELEQKVIDRIGCLIQSGDLKQESMVQIIELVGSYLNLRTISDYARENNLSYNGVKKTRKILNLFGTKFIID